MKKRALPMIVAIILIVLIVGISALLYIKEKYSYSTERIDLNEYYYINNENEMAIIWNNELQETDAIYQAGICYLPIEFANDYINNHFYLDCIENLVIFTTDYDQVITALGTSSYYINGVEIAMETPLTLINSDTAYLSVEFLKKLCNFSYTCYENPNRVVLTTEFDPIKVAAIKKDTQIRALGGIKSAIVTDVMQDEQVTILEEMDTWTKVINNQGYYGYVENKTLKPIQTIEQVKVTDVEEPTYPAIHRDHKICLVWNMVTNTSANGLVDGLLDRTKGVNVVSPTWFALSDNEGNFTSLADADYVRRMHARGVEVWALIDNFSLDISTEQILSATSSRTHLIQQLIQTTLQYGIDGINVDFEHITKGAAAGYIQFLRELSIECRKNNIVLSADNSHLVNYDRAKQGEVVDYVIIMGYDEHIAAVDGPGSVASIDFVQTGIEKTLALVPANKVINGIPFYTRLWTTNGEIGNTAYGMGEIESLLSSKGVTPMWDDVTCQYVAEYSEGETNYAVWLEESKSLGVKLGVMEQYDLAGLAAWRLGQEKSEVWDEINAYLQK